MIVCRMVMVNKLLEIVNIKEISERDIETDKEFENVMKGGIKANEWGIWYMVKVSLYEVIKEDIKENEIMGRCMDLGNFHGLMVLFIKG